MTEQLQNYVGYYINDNEYQYTYLKATDTENNRIPRLGSVIGYAQAMVDFSDEESYQVIDYIDSCLDDDNILTVIVKTNSQCNIPSSFFKTMTDAWVNITQGSTDQVNYCFNHHRENTENTENTENH